MRSGRLLAERYRLDTLIGRGGMGEVWRATDERLKRTVAVKVLPSHGVPDQAITRFRREAEIAAGLQHPGIATIFDIDADPDDGTLFLVMELLRGTDLAALSDDHPDGLPVKRAADLLAQIADALAEAHDNGVVHRDVKPSNVMLLPGDRTKILDFGVARYAEQTGDLTGSAVIGTPAFMAPEQFDRSSKVDHRADLYALGGVAYQLLTGRRPFAAETMPQLIRDVMFTPAPAVSDARPDVPETLDALVAALLAKDPADRPGDARDVAARLRALADGHDAPSLPATLEATSLEDSRDEARQETSPSSSEAQPSLGPVGQVLFLLGILILLGLAVVCLAQAAAMINPGGILVNRGSFPKAPYCTALQPDGLTTDYEYHSPGDDRSSCTWESRDEDGPTVEVRLKSHGTEVWTPAPEMARRAMANARDVDGVKGVTGPARPEPSLGKDAFGYRVSVEYRHEYIVFFRRDNLVVEMHYSQYRPKLSAAEIRRRALRTATEINRRITP